MMSKAEKTALALASLLLCGIAPSSPADDVYAWLRFEEKNDSIVDSGPAGLHGVYLPSDTPDNDTPETRDPARYRGTAPDGGGTLKFFRELRSCGRLDGLKTPKRMETLHMKAVVRLTDGEPGMLASCLDRTAKGGFALAVKASNGTSTEWSFSCGDGSAIYSANIRTGSATARWTTMELNFNAGKLTLKLDGAGDGSATLPAKTIKEGSGTLMIGGGGGFQPLDGEMSELLIAKAQVSLKRQGDGSTGALHPPEVLCEPVDGTERTFGRKTFHTFCGAPLPMSFLFRGESDILSPPALEITMPKSLKIVEAFQSNGADDSLSIPSREDCVIDGVQCSRWLFTGIKLGNALFAKTPDLAREAVANFGKSTTLTVAIDCDAPAPETSWIRWSLSAGGTQFGGDSAEIRFLPELQPQPDGRFRYMAYKPASEMAFHDRKLFLGGMENLKRSGLTAKGRFNPNDRRRSALDAELLKNGFELYEINIWDGPIKKRRSEKASLQMATTADGTKSLTHYCPDEVLKTPAFKADYLKKLLTRIAPAGTGTSHVMFDYEPWSFTSRMCFCPRCMSAFKAFSGAKGELTPQTLKGRYKDDWARFWCERSAALIAMMAECARKTLPEAKLVDYTYCCDYDSPEAMSKFLWSCPKDPRRIESIVDESMLSIYHFDARGSFDAIERSRRCLKKDISAIILIARANANTGSYTKPEEALSPRQVEQRALLCAALGIRTVGIWPGTNIDAAYLKALGDACRIARTYERHYLDGQRVQAGFKVEPSNPAETANASAWTAWRDKGGGWLLTIFNFKDKPQEFSVTAPADVKKLKAQDGRIFQGGRVSVGAPAGGYVILESKN